MKRACVIGWPIEHSRSPMIHGAWLRHYGIDGSYERVAVAPVDIQSFLTGLPQSGLQGCNVTVPHKEAAFKLADVQDESAKAVGAANTLWVENGKLHATNTDTYGFMAHLKQRAPQWTPDQAPAVILGAGGAARAVVYGLLDAGQTQLRLINRTEQRARDVQAHFTSTIEVVPWQECNEAVADAGLIVNTTSLGLDGQSAPEIELSLAPKSAIVFDIVYTPLETPFLKAAVAEGLQTIDGLGMLLHQAVPGFEKWFGVRPDVTEALYKLVADNIMRPAC